MRVKYLFHLFILIIVGCQNQDIKRQQSELIDSNSTMQVISPIDTSRYFDSPAQIDFDTLSVPDSCIIIINPNKTDLEKVKSEMDEDDFYTASDDMMFYLYQIRNKLDSLNYMTYTTESKHLVLLSSSDTFLIQVDTIEEFWPIVKFNNRKGAEIVDIWHMMDYLVIE